MKLFKAKSVIFLFATVLLTAGFVMSNMASATVPGVNELVSVDSSGNQANQDSVSSGNSISADGRYVVFQSSATNLVSGDTNGFNDIFVRDRTNTTTARVSISSSGAQANGGSLHPRISYDGRYVVFESAADNLSTGVSSGYLHIYLRDLQTGTTTVIDTSGTGTLGNSNSQYPDLSADGRFIVFQSMASNLVSGINPSGIGSQIFIKDRSTGAIKALSVDSSGAQGNNSSLLPRISCDGGIVAFMSNSSNLAPGDTNGEGDIFVDVLGWDEDQLVNITISGNASSNNPVVSCDGNQIAYDTLADNLATGLPAASHNVLEYSRLGSSTAVVSSNSSGNPAAGASQTPSLSGDGRYVVFQSDATTNLEGSRSYNIFGNQQQTYIKDMKQGTTQVLSVGSTGKGVSGSVDWPAISADGLVVAYDSVAENTMFDSQRALVSSDSNGKQDIFVSQTGF